MPLGHGAREGKACLHFNTLADADLAVLEQVMALGRAGMNEAYPARLLRCLALQMPDWRLIQRR